MQWVAHALFPNQHSLFCYPFFSNEYLNIQVIISKMTNERSVKRLSSSHIFPYFRRLSCMSTLLLNFLWNLYTPPCFGEMFKTMVFALLENAFLCQKIESRHFYSCSHPCQVKLSPPGSCHLFSAAFFQKSIHHSSRGGRKYDSQSISQSYALSLNQLVVLYVGPVISNPVP